MARLFSGVYITPLFIFMSLFSSLNGTGDDVSVDIENTDNNTFEEFIATYEWQTIKKGQPIPRGLHVRINFQTGETEAKLVDPKETKGNPTAVSALRSENEESDLKRDSSNNDMEREYLEVALSKMKEDEISNNQDDSDILKKFRTYEELKKDLKDINLLVKTDLEVLTILMDNFTTSTEEMKITILTDIELLVHQFDNAREFTRMDGFVNIVYPSFNSSNTQLRAEAIKLFGSATQSNPKVQISALSSGGIPLLLRTLLLDNDLTVRSRALYALSCLIRNFPIAQNKMINEGGLTVLSEVFDRVENRILQVKVITLLHDLMVERTSTERSIKESQSPTKEMKQKLHQYKSVNFEEKLLEAEWCTRIPSLMFSDPESPKLDSDSVEKVVSAMIALSNTCKREFEGNTVRGALKNLAHFYGELDKNEPDQYFADLVTLITSLINKLKPVNDEL